MRHDVEFPCGLLAMETVRKKVTMNQNEKIQYKIRVVKVVLKLFKLASHSCSI